MFLQVYRPMKKKSFEAGQKTDNRPKMFLGRLTVDTRSSRIGHTIRSTIKRPTLEGVRSIVQRRLQANRACLIDTLRTSGKTFIKCKQCMKTYSTNSNSINLPKKIKRGPTDILRAIANTITRDPTAAHYKYHDDPYLIPHSSLEKRSYALSQEAGRKAAYWIRQEHADLFQHKVAQPPIEAFIPKPIYDENTVIDEKDLEKAIKNVWISDAISIYNILKEKQVEVSREGKQNLLEFLCYYNCEDPISEDWIEERWFKFSETQSWNKMKKTWKDNSLAETIFKELNPPDSRSYSALISGMASYGDLQKAWTLFEESSAKNIPINVTAFNAILAKANFLRESHEMMMKFVEELLCEMNRRKVAPNLGTLNAILESLGSMYMIKKSRENALRALTEFRQLGIKPSLGSYYHLLNIFCRDKNQKSNILDNILNEIEGTPLIVEDLKDCKFFTRAMEVCRNHLGNKELAYKLNAILHTDNNYNFIGDSYSESNYYRFFFFLLSETEQIDVFMKTYESLVPNIYIPDPTVMQEILNAVDMNASWEFLPRLFSDMILFDHFERSNLVETILSCASKVYDENLFQRMNEIGVYIFEKLEGPQRERNFVQWTGKILSDLMMIFLNTKDKEHAALIFEKLFKSQNAIVGEPEFLPIGLYFEECLSDGNIDVAIKCVSYCHDIGFLETESMAKKLNSSVELSVSQKTALESVIGKEALEEKQKASQ